MTQNRTKLAYIFASIFPVIYMLVMPYLMGSLDSPDFTRQFVVQKNTFPQI
jgi:hypothetical protein